MATAIHDNSDKSLCCAFSIAQYIKVAEMGSANTYKHFKCVYIAVHDLSSDIMIREKLWNCQVRATVFALVILHCVYIYHLSLSALITASVSI